MVEGKSWAIECGIGGVTVVTGNTEAILRGNEDSDAEAKKYQMKQSWGFPQRTHFARQCNLQLSHKAFVLAKKL